MRKLILFLVILSATGCVATWTKTAGLHKSTDLGFSVEMPDGWMKLTRKDAILLSKDGVLLQNILIKKQSIDENLEFTQKRFHVNMLPHETAEVFLDNERLNTGKMNFVLMHTAPAKVSGHPAFDVAYAFNTKDGLDRITICHGFVANNYFYQLTYTAAKRYYYDRDLGTYNQLVKSFQLSSK